MDPHNPAYGIRAPPPILDQAAPVVDPSSSYQYYTGDPWSIPNPPQHQDPGYTQQNQSHNFIPLPPPPPPPPPDEPDSQIPGSAAYRGGYAQPAQAQAAQNYWNEHGQWIGYYTGQDPQQPGQGQGPAHLTAHVDPHQQQYEECYHYQYDTQYAGHQGNQHDLTQAQVQYPYCPTQAAGVDVTNVPTTPPPPLTEQSPSQQEEPPSSITQIPVDLSQMIIRQAMAQHYIVAHEDPQTDLTSGAGLVNPPRPKSAVPEWLKQEMMKRGIKQPNSEEGDDQVPAKARRFTEEKPRASGVEGKSGGRNGGSGSDRKMEASIELNKAVKAIALPLLLDVTQTMFDEIANESIFESREGQASKLAMPIIEEVAESLLADIAAEVHGKAMAERSMSLASKETSKAGGGGKSSSEGALGIDLLGLGYASDSSNSNAESPEVKATLDSNRMEVEAKLDEDVHPMEDDEGTTSAAKKGPLGGDAVNLTKSSENQGIINESLTKRDIEGSGGSSHGAAKLTVQSRKADIGETLSGSTVQRGHVSGPEKPTEKARESILGWRGDQKRSARANDRHKSGSPNELEESKLGGSHGDKKKGSRGRSPSKKHRKRSLRGRSRSGSRDTKKRHNQQDASSKARRRNFAERHRATSPSMDSITSSASDDRGRRELKQRDSQRSRSSRRKKPTKERKSRHS